MMTKDYFFDHMDTIVAREYNTRLSTAARKLAEEKFTLQSDDCKSPLLAYEHALFDLDLDYDEIMNFAGMVLRAYEEETGEDAIGLDAETRNMMEKAMKVVNDHAHPDLRPIRERTKLARRRE